MICWNLRGYSLKKDKDMHNIQFEIHKPSEIDKIPKVKVTIEYNGEVISMDVLNVFGGSIAKYTKNSPTTGIIPLIVGDITPGMVFSYISTTLTCAMSILNNVGVPRDILKDIAHAAIDEGLYGKTTTMKETNN